MEPATEALPDDIAALRALILRERAERVRLDAEALAADPKVPGLTLMNTLAQRQALALQSTSKDYFE